MGAAILDHVILSTNAIGYCRIHTFPARWLQHSKVGEIFFCKLHEQSFFVTFLDTNVFLRICSTFLCSQLYFHVLNVRVRARTRLSMEGMSGPLRSNISRSPLLQYFFDSHPKEAGRVVRRYFWRLMVPWN